MARARKTTRKRKATRRKKMGSSVAIAKRTFPGGRVTKRSTIAFHKAQVKKQLESKLGELSVKYYKADTVKATKKIAKQIAQVKQQLRMYQ